MGRLLSVSIPAVLVGEQKRKRPEGAADPSGAHATSVLCPYSDHLPLLLTPETIVRRTSRRRFCFDNMWLREERCREIVTQSWEHSRGLDIFARVDCCGRDLWKWGRSYNKDYLRKIEDCKRRMYSLRARRDDEGVRDYGAAEKEFLFLLEQ
nr:uncharacterized protein LOC109147742 [Ipomoea batatas]